MLAPRVKVAAALIGITTVLALLSVAQTVAWFSYQGRGHPPYNVLIVGRLFDWYTCLIFLPVLWWLVRRLQAARASWPATIATLLFASIVVSAAKYAIFLPLQQWISGNDTTTLAGVLSGNVIVEMMIFWAAIALMYGFEYYRQFKERESVQLQLERRISEMQLDALRAQLHPHFLFNTLHPISGLMRINVNAADLMIDRLGDLLRMTLDTSGIQQVPLKQELDVLKKYLEIEQTRFESRLSGALHI
jgi:riboflavin transporter FmnP